MHFIELQNTNLMRHITHLKYDMLVVVVQNTYLMGSTQREQLVRLIQKYKKRFDVSVAEYDTKRFHEMITLLKNHVNSFNDYSIDCIGKLRTTITSLDDVSKKKKTTKSMKNVSKRLSNVTDDNDNAILLQQYFEWYIKYIDYLLQLIQSFHIEVFLPLSSSLSAWVNESPIATPMRSTQSSRMSSISFGETGFHTSRRLSVPVLTRELRLPDNMKGEVSELLSLLHTPKGNEIREQISELLQQLNRLLDDEMITSDVVTTTKLPSVANNKTQNSNDFSAFESLMPCVFDKFSQCLTLSEDWLEWDKEQMNKLYLRRPRLDQLQKILVDQKSNVLRDIESYERNIDSKYEQVRRLSVREERGNALKTKVFQLESSLSELRTQLHTLEQDKLRFIDAMTEAAKQKLGRQEADKIRMDYAQNKLARMLVKRNIDSDEYMLRLLRDDVELENELKPSFVRFTNDAQEQCEELEQQLQTKHEQKLMLESVLKPLREHQYAELTDKETEAPFRTLRKSQSISKLPIAVSNGKARNDKNDKTLSSEENRTFSKYEKQTSNEQNDPGDVSMINTAISDGNDNSLRAGNKKIMKKSTTSEELSSDRSNSSEQLNDTHRKSKNARIEDHLISATNNVTEDFEDRSSNAHVKSVTQKSKGKDKLNSNNFIGNDYYNQPFLRPVTLKQSKHNGPVAEEASMHKTTDNFNSSNSSLKTNKLIKSSSPTNIESNKTQLRQPIDKSIDRSHMGFFIPVDEAL